MVGPGGTVLDRGVDAVLVDRVGRRTVGKKNAIETTALKGAGEVLPIGKVMQAFGLLLVRVGPAEQGMCANRVDQHLHQVHL